MGYDLMSRIPDLVNPWPLLTFVSKKTIFVSERYGASVYKLKQLLHRVFNIEKKNHSFHVLLDSYATVWKKNRTELVTHVPKAYV